MEYNLFKKEILGKGGKKRKRWYYWYYDSTGKQIQKSCLKCETKAEAEAYINSLPSLKAKYQDIKIADIAEKMYIPYSDHWERRRQYGKSIKQIT